MLYRLYNDADIEGLAKAMSEAYVGSSFFQAISLKGYRINDRFYYYYMN